MTAPTGPAATGTGAVPPPITVNDVSKDYSDVSAVSDLTFAVRRGSITGLLGHPGSGKTTVLRMILGLVKPTAGDTAVEGMPFGRLVRPARTIGAALGNRNLHPHRTPSAHLRIYTAAVGVPDSRAEEVLATVGISEAAHHPAETLSPNQRRRLALATALLGNPRILVLDELFSGNPGDILDATEQVWLREFLQNYTAGGGTVLLSSPELHDVENLLDHVVVLNEGKLVFQGHIDHLRRARQDRLVIACSAPAALATALAGRGHVDARSLADGRLAVAGVPDHSISVAAQESGVTVYGVVRDRIDLDQLYAQIASGRFVAGASNAAPAGYGVPTFGWPGQPNSTAQIQPPPGYPPNQYPQYPSGRGGPR